VREDVTDIVLNIKDVASRCRAKGRSAWSLGQGPGRRDRRRHRTVGDIEILNPDL
jgi:DNA-directed RNA polymerase subunit alpha